MNTVDIDKLNELRAAATRGSWTEEPVVRCEHVEVHAAEANRTVAMWLDANNAKLIVSLVNAWPQIEAELRQLRSIAEASKKLREARRMDPNDLVEQMSRELVLDVELAGLRSLQPRTEK